MKTQPTTTEPSDAAVVPYPMDTAPKDGTIVRLLVRFTDGSFEDVEPGVATWTIGQNGADHHPEDDEWLFAGWNWEQDCFTQGEGEPIGWLPLHGERSAPAAAVGGGVPCANPQAAFDNWFGVSRYTQVILPDSVTRKIALDAWNACLDANPTPPAGGFVVDECAAISTGHHFSNCGPKGEVQCRYCGESPTAQPSAKDGVRGDVTDEMVETGCIAAVDATGLLVKNWPEKYPDAAQLRKVIRAALEAAIGREVSGNG